MPETWRPGWESWIDRRLHELGFDSLAALLSSTPVLSYAEIAKRLSTGDRILAPIQIVPCQYLEATLRHTVRAAAMDHLARLVVERFPQGWKQDASNYAVVSLLADWETELIATGNQARFEERAERVSGVIQEQQLPEGWRPSNGNDPYLASVFERAGWSA